MCRQGLHSEWELHETYTPPLLLYEFCWWIPSASVLIKIQATWTPSAISGGQWAWLLTSFEMGKASFILFRTGSPCVAQADFEQIPDSGNLLSSCFNLPIAGIMNVCRHSYLFLFFTAVEELKPKVLCMLGKGSMTEPHPWSARVHL